MLVSDLREKLKYMPDNAFIYLDDTKMPTPLGLVDVQFDVCSAFQITRTETGRISAETSTPFHIGVVTLTTYRRPDEGKSGWTVELSDTNGQSGQPGTRSKSKKKKSKAKSRRSKNLAMK